MINIMKINIIIRLCSLIVLVALSQNLYAQENSQKPDTLTTLKKYDQEVKLTFNTITARKTAGSVYTIDVQQELKSDQYNSIGEILNGKVPGLFGAYNTWGTGNAVILVDGVRQNEFYVNSLNPMEIGTITILKDALSKALYGAQGDLGVILINSLRGEAGTHKLRIGGQYGVATPRAMPEYLNAADYMTKYNEAQLNDGIDPAFRLLYRNEYAVELAYEGVYWFNIRRWKRAHLQDGVQLQALTFDVDSKKAIVESTVKRANVTGYIFKDQHYWMPFETSLTRFTADWEQNPGW